MASFSFSFSGDDIEADDAAGTARAEGLAGASVAAAASQPPAAAATASAFPVQGKPQLPPCRHLLRDMLARLPSKIAYGFLDVELEAEAAAGAVRCLRLPRRELWDVRVQVMAEEEEGDDDSAAQEAVGGDRDAKGMAPGLGTHDVKTGIYEGGFKSWESSVDMVKVLLRPADTPSGSRPSEVATRILSPETPAHLIELGCGTALPTLALFQWACATRAPGSVASSGDGASAPAAPSAPTGSQCPSPGPNQKPLLITVADYNPSVLHLVTLPNLLLTWALQRQNADPALLEAFTEEEEDGSAGGPGGELELTEPVKDAFCAFLAAAGITLSFLSGGWSPAFVDLLYAPADARPAGANTLVLGAETIYSPFALEAFSATLLAVLQREREAGTAAAAIVGAKKLYFGVGGSLDDFVVRMRDAGTTVTELREEAEGVRRGVVQCL